MPQGLDKLAKGVSKVIKTLPDSCDDTLKPAKQELGKTVALIPRTINAALIPLRQWIATREYNLAETEKLLAQKLELVGTDKIVTPEAYVAVPAIQAISYSMDSKELRDLYANLLAKAMYTKTKDSVHPAFIDIIRQMSPIDAILFKEIKEHEIRPLITISEREPNGSLIPIFKNCSWLQKFSLQQCYFSFCNLSRLGLIKIPEIGEYTYTGHYDIVKQNILFQEAEKIAIQQLKKDSTLFYEKHFIELNDFSLSFYETCVNDNLPD